MTMPNPPATAQSLLGLVLPLNARETVCGELLEEYADAAVPHVGHRGADLWYWRPVGSIWLRAYSRLVVPLVLLLVVHGLFNTFRAPSGASYLADLPSLALVPIALGVFALAGAYGSWRTERWEGGLVAAFGTFVVVWLFMAVWSNATLYPFAHVQQTNPYWIQAWQWSTHRGHPPSPIGFGPDTANESFLHWMFWDNVGSLIIAGFA